MDFHENINISLHLSDLAPISEFKSEHQNVGLYQHPLLGKVLILNNEIQHIEKYQCHYHEPLVHLPMSFIEAPKNCLILGGGSLFAAFEVLKYPSIEKIVLCDYDHAVLNLMASNYKHAQQVIMDKRFHSIEEDATIFIKELNEKFDLIINDCFDLSKKSNHSLMYEDLYNLCSEQGVCSDVIYRHIFDQSKISNSMNLIKSYANLALSLIIVPEYPGILHILTVWGKNRFISQEQKNTMNKFQNDPENDNKFNLFSPNNLPYYLYLPPYIKKIIS